MGRRRRSKVLWKEVRMQRQRSGKAPKGRQAGRAGGGEGKGGHRRGGKGARQGRGGAHSLKHTGARPVDGAGRGRGGEDTKGWAMVLPATWSPVERSECRGRRSGKTGTAGTASALSERSYRTATRTDTDGHGQTRTDTDKHGRLERAEVRGQERRRGGWRWFFLTSDFFP